MNNISFSRKLAVKYPWLRAVGDRSWMTNLLYKFIPSLCTYTYVHCRPGWYVLIEALCAELDKVVRGTDGWERSAVVSGIEERLGMLSFFIFGVDDTKAAYTLIEQYKAASAEICSFCGSPGSFVEFGYYRCVVCPVHRQVIMHDPDLRRIPL